MKKLIAKWFGRTPKAPTEGPKQVGYAYTVNGSRLEFSLTMPPDDAYDFGTLRVLEFVSPFTVHELTKIEQAILAINEGDDFDMEESLLLRAVQHGFLHPTRFEVPEDAIRRMSHSWSDLLHRYSQSAGGTYLTDPGYLNMARDIGGVKVRDAWTNEIDKNNMRKAGLSDGVQRTTYGIPQEENNGKNEARK